jgi:outer membrane receptor for ferrienterochelin and colicins
MSSRQHHLRLAVIAAALSAAMSAHAQQAASAPAEKPAKPADEKMQQVEVRGSTEAYNPRRDDTASKIVVNHDEIVKYGDTSVVDVLKRLPGITVSGGSARGGGEVRMRGLGAGYTQILLNGEAAPAGFSLDSLAPDVIERIEVLRSASAEFSTQSIAGTINIILKKAIKKGQRELKAGVGKGAGFVNPTANLQLSDKLGQMSYSFTANVFHRKYEQDTPSEQEGFDPAGRLVMQRNSQSRDNGQFSAINLSPRLNWTLANGDTITSQSFVNVNRYRGNDNVATFTTVGPQPAYPRAWFHNLNENEFFRTDLNWVHKLETGAKLDLKVGGVVGGLGNEQRRLGFNPAGAQTLDSEVLSKGTDRGVTSTGKFSTPMFEGHALSVGWDGGISTRDDQRAERGLPVELFDARVDRFAAYAQDEWNITPRWSVYLGARWEGIRTRTAGNTFDTAETTSSVWSPLFQTLYKLPGTKSDQVRFAVTRTYKAPNTQSLIPRRFKSVNNSSTEPDFQGNPDLRPELALGLDASYEHYWGEGALLSASASMRRIDNFTRNGVLFDGERWVQLPVNDGRATTRGIELEAKFPLKSLIATAPALDLRASVSRNWSSVDAVPGPNNRLNAQTPFSATLGVDYKLGALTTGGSFAFKTGGPVRISTTQSSYQTARRELEVYGLWKFSPQNQLRVAVSNILGQGYEAQNTYADQFGTVNRSTSYKGPVVLRATMEMKF